MAQQHEQLQPGPMQIHHGHTDTHVIVQFSRPCRDIVLTTEQAEAFIKALYESIGLLAAHQTALAQKGN